MDYATFSEAFSLVYAGDILTKTRELGYWEQINDRPDCTEEIDELNRQIKDLEMECDSLYAEGKDTDKLEEQLDALRSELEELEEDTYDDFICQFFIVDEFGAQLIQECTHDPLFYNEYLDLYVWGITFCGIRWEYALTSIPCD